MFSHDPYRLEVVYPQNSPVSNFSENTSADVTDLLHIGSLHSGRAYASAALKAEVEELREAGGLPTDAFYHCTSSKALPRISEQKALLCSREAMRIYENVETGEIDHSRTDDWPPRALDDVYAHCNISTSYFFGNKSEYPVVFGLKDVVIQDAYGDGYKLGPRVYLEKVVSVTVPDEQLKVAKDWVAENCKPGTIAMSLYAASLLTTLKPMLTDWRSSKYVN